MKKKTEPFLFCLKKLISFALSLFILSLAVFCISRLAPGDPLYAYYGDRVEKMSIEEREAAEERLGLDEPIHIQYVSWLKSALKGDFGISYKYKTDVLEVIANRSVNTLLLGGLGFVLIFQLALVIGTFCAMHEDSRLDKLIGKTGTVVSCIPEFWLSLILILVFAVTLHWLPSGGAYSVETGGSISDRALHLLLPLAAVVISHLWYYAYMIRNKLLEEMRSEYVLLARTKGLSNSFILIRHCLRNAIPSFLSIMAISVPHILGGTYVIEAVFSYPGIGMLSYESVRYKDYNMLMVICLFSGMLVILCNTVASIINEHIDPRLKNKVGSEEAEGV